MKKVTKVISFIGIVVVLICIIAPIHNALIVNNTKTGNYITAFPVKDNDEFVISFIHSINKRPVYEYIKIAGKQLNIYKARYDAFGAGMPETSTDGLHLAMKEHGVLELTNINRIKNDISIFVGTVAEHVIEINGSRISLDTLAKPGESLTFKVGRVSYFDFWKRRINL